MCLDVKIRMMVEEDVVDLRLRIEEEDIVDLRLREEVEDIVDLRLREEEEEEEVVQDHNLQEERKTFPKLVKPVGFIFLRSNSNDFKRKSPIRVPWRINA